MLNNLSPRELQLLLLGSSTAVSYALIVLLVMSYDLKQFAFQFFYLISTTCFPIGLLCIFRRCFSGKQESMTHLGLWMLFTNLLLIGALSCLISPYSVETATEVICAWMVVQIIAWIFHIWKTHFFEQIITHRYFCRVMCFMIALFPVAAFFNTFYSNFLLSAYGLLRYFYYSNNTLVLNIFFGGSVLGIILLIQLFCFEKRKASSLSKYYTTALCFSPILLFDVMNNFDIEHYNAYVAPAIAVLHGKIPLIDVFCHYGFSYLLFTLIFMILPNNYAVLGAVVSTLNVWCLIIYLLMLKRLVKNPTYFLILSISSLLGTHYLLAHSENIIPSSMAMRYFPTFLITYLLFNRFYHAKDTDDKTWFKSPSLIGVMILNALWSMESIVFLCLICTTYFWLKTKTWKSFTISFCEMIAVILSPYILIGVFYAIFFQKLPNYLTYIKYIYYYLDPNTKIGSRFLLINNGFVERFFIWVPMAVMHVVGLFYLLYHRFIKNIQDTVIQSILFLNTAGVACIVYFILQPSLFSYICTGYFSLLVLLGGLIQLKERTKSSCFRFGINFSLIGITYIFLLIISLSVKSKPITGEPSGNILTQFLYDGNFFDEKFFYNLTHFCTDKIIQDRTDILAITENSCTRNSYHQEMYNLIKKWFSNQDEILLFHRDLTEALVEHKKIHKLMVSPLNDYLSYDIRKSVLSKVDSSVSVGDILVVEKDLNLFPIENAILKKINSLFNCVLLEETEHFKVFKLEKKEKNKKSDLLFPIQPVGAVSSLVYRSQYNIEEVKGGLGALFDNDKETSWFATKGNIFNKNTFWVKIDLGQEYYIDNIKLWRTIDFRVPELFSQVRNIFPKNFNIKLSTDQKKWTIEASEKQYRLLGNNYYDAKFNHQKARYIMIDVFVDKADAFYISEVEIFGEQVKG